MAELDDTLRLTRLAVEEAISAARECAARWTAPRAPGAWSPSQVVEHVARSLDASVEDIAGRPSAFPDLPRPIRAIVRMMLFDRVVRGGDFPRKLRTNRRMNPAAGPATPVEGVLRLETAWSALAAAITRAAAHSDVFTSRTFGRVRLADYLLFQMHHTRHHTAQLTQS